MTLMTAEIENPCPARAPAQGAAGREQVSLIVFSFSKEVLRLFQALQNLNPPGLCFLSEILENGFMGHFLQGSVSRYQ